MSPFIQNPFKLALGRRVAASLVAAAGLIPGVGAAEAPRSAQTAGPASPLCAGADEVPLRTDRLERSVIERASKQRTPKAPSFPAERR